MTLFEMQARHLFRCAVSFSENFRIRIAKTSSQETLDKLIKAIFKENPVYSNLRLELINARSYYDTDSKDATKAFLNKLDGVFRSIIECLQTRSSQPNVIMIGKSL